MICCYPCIMHVPHILGANVLYNLHHSNNEPFSEILLPASLFC